MSPELETLDQLLGSDLTLDIIRTLYATEEAFHHGLHGLLACGDARLISTDGSELPPWRWRELLTDDSKKYEINKLKLRITEQGIQRIS